MVPCGRKFLTDLTRSQYYLASPWPPWLPLPTRRLEGIGGENEGTRQADVHSKDMPIDFVGFGQCQLQQIMEMDKDRRLMIDEEDKGERGQQR